MLAGNSGCSPACMAASSGPRPAPRSASTSCLKEVVPTGAGSSIITTPRSEGTWEKKLNGFSVETVYRLAVELLVTAVTYAVQCIIDSLSR